MSILEKFVTMDYGPAPEDPREALAWLEQYAALATSSTERFEDPARRKIFRNDRSFDIGKTSRHRARLRSRHRRRRKIRSRLTRMT